MNAILREQNHDELAKLCQTSDLRLNYITVFLPAVAPAKKLSGYRRLAYLRTALVVGM